MKKKQLSQSEIKVIAPKATPFGISLQKKDQVVELDSRLLLINGKPALFLRDENIYPTLKLILSNSSSFDGMKKAIVDMGAVKFVVNGADIMRPGIVAIDDGILKDDIVVVVDQNNKKPLAVCIALFSSEEMRTMAQGKVLKNLHYVGDEIWKIA